MRTRIVIGAGAWLLGAAAATAGSLWVVSELGQGISASPSEQSTVAALSQAQATKVAAQPSSSPSSRSKQAAAGTGGTSGTKAGSGTGGSNTAGTNTASTVLTSSGGSVVAQCATAGAFLLSWSPQQGFQASSVARGPATTARVVFSTAASTVTMAVTCPAGVPVAATSVSSAPAPAPSPSATDDNGGGGGKGGGGGDG